MSKLSEEKMIENNVAIGLRIFSQLILDPMTSQLLRFEKHLGDFCKALPAVDVSVFDLPTMKDFGMVSNMPFKQLMAYIFCLYADLLKEYANERRPGIMRYYAQAILTALYTAHYKCADSSDYVTGQEPPLDE